MQTNAVSYRQSPQFNLKYSGQNQISSPVLDRLMKEVKNKNVTTSYDRVHNHHNRSGN